MIKADKVFIRTETEGKSSYTMEGYFKLEELSNVIVLSENELTEILKRKDKIISKAAMIIKTLKEVGNSKLTDDMIQTWERMQAIAAKK